MDVQEQVSSAYSALVLETLRNIKEQSQDEKDNFDTRFVHGEASSAVLDGKRAMKPKVKKNAEISSNQSPNRPCIRAPIELERNEHEVESTLTKGCYCLSRNCLSGLDAECIYTHRRNLSELSKAEYEMFLTGIVMNSLIASKTQKKFHMRHSYKGRGVCKTAFLYLHYCKIELLNDIIGRVIGNGITPIVTKHNMIAEELLLTITMFLSEYIKENSNVEDVDLKEVISLPFGTTRKGLHESYRAYVEKLRPVKKSCTYTTFSDILRDNFPNILISRFGGKREALNENTPPIIEGFKTEKIVEDKSVQTSIPIAIITCEDMAQGEERKMVEYAYVLQNSKKMNAIRENISHIK